MSAATRTGIKVADFLLDRLEEDYEIAWGADPSPWSNDGAKVLDRHGAVIVATSYGGTLGHVLRFDPTAVLAEIEAKRAVIHRCSRVDALMPCSPLAFHILEDLAVPYADHPDFDPAWTHE